MPETAETAAAVTRAAIDAAVKAALEIRDSEHRLGDIETRMVSIDAKMDVAFAKLAAIDTAANRWKGGFLVIVALGAIIGWLVSVGGSISKLWK